GGDLRVLRDERLVVRVVDDELERESLRIGETEGADGAAATDALLPEVERLLGADAPHDPVHHAGAGAAAARVRILEEGDVAAGGAALVGVEEVVDGRVVLVDGLLDEPQAERARVELDVSGRVGGDAGDVVDSLETHDYPI